MKRVLTYLALVLAMAATGCHRKHEDGSPVGIGSTIPGSCSWSVQDYAGALAANLEICWTNGSPTPSVTTCSDKYQTVNVIADPIDYPTDRLAVVMYDAAGTARTTPNTTVTIRHNPNAVQFRNASEAGYVRYAIHAEVCR